MDSYLKGGRPTPISPELHLMSAYNSAIRPVDSPDGSIGRPVAFVSGQFEGRTIRTEIIELQKADLGRKYARKDRRPLDPPPVVQLRLYEVFDAGTHRESEQELDLNDDVRGFGILCHVDLFPVPSQDEVPQQQSGGRKQRQPRHRARLNEERLIAPSAGPPGVPISPVTPSASPISPSISLHHQSHLPFNHTSQQPSFISRTTRHPQLSSDSCILPPLIPSYVHSSVQQPYNYTQNSNLDGPLPSMQAHMYDRQQAHSQVYQSSFATVFAQSISVPSSQELTGVVAYLGNYPITEESKCTEALVGASFCQSATLDYQGKKVLMFVFSDLAVRIEGTFILRYRVFNIFARAHGSQDIPVLAECYGGAFKIYSTKEFPGLRASTDFTKYLSYFGVRLNLRENERKRRKKNAPSPARSYISASANEAIPGPSTHGHNRRDRRGRQILGSEDSDDNDRGPSDED